MIGPNPCGRCGGEYGFHRRDCSLANPPELTIEERQILDSMDMTPVLGTLEERLGSRDRGEPDRLRWAISFLSGWRARNLRLKVVSIAESHRWCKGARRLAARLTVACDDGR